MTEAMGLTALMLTGLLTTLYIFNRLKFPKDSWMHFVKMILKRKHILIAKIFVIIGLIHGFLSEVSVLSLNFGTITWFMSMLLGLNFILRKYQRKKVWLFYHRLLAGLMVVSLVIHLIEVEI